MQKIEGMILIQVSLENTQPRIWRRFVCPVDLLLNQLHHVIQIVMGWHGRHEYEFDFNGRIYARDAYKYHLEAIYNTYDDSAYRICHLVSIRKPSFFYTYDLGDKWLHKLEVLDFNVTLTGFDPPLIQVTEGECACPPEDIGGAEEFEEFVSANEDKSHPRRKHFLSWYLENDLYKGIYNPDHFDINQTNRELEKYIVWSNLDIPEF